MRGDSGILIMRVLSRAVRLAPLLFAVNQFGFAAAVEFNRDIRPILSDKCFACHGPDAANRKTKMRFDIESGARVAIVPGDPEKSELVRRISSEDKSVRMPPAYAGKEKLSSREIGLIRRWIGEGAPWQKHWSFIPPVRPAVPQVHDGLCSGIRLTHLSLRGWNGKWLHPLG